MSTSHSRALLCAFTVEAGHGGIARVSSLLWRVMQAHYRHSCKLLTAASAGRDRLTWIEKMKFLGAAVRRQVFDECDVLFFDHLGLARVQRVVPGWKRRPYGIFLHSLEAWSHLSPDRLRTLIDAKLRVANSYHTAARIAAAHPEVGEISVCHLALGSEISRPHLLEDNCAKRVNRAIVEQITPQSALIVGRIMKSERYKGHDQLIQSWADVRRRVADAQLVIVGRGDDIPRLQALARQQGVEGSVLFTGPVNDHTLHAIYQRVALFAMPSRAEGFGIVYLEAMLHRLPCIGSFHDAAGEIIVDGETGFLVDQNDVSNLAEKMIELLENPVLRCQLGCNGFERLHQRFSFERFQTRISELLNELEA